MSVFETVTNSNDEDNSNNKDTNNHVDDNNTNFP